MIGLTLILSAIVTSALVGTALRLPSLVSTLLATYLAFVANLALVTLVLSPFRDVTRAGLTVAESVLLLAAGATWLRRGRPGLPLTAARRAISEITRDPLTLVYLTIVLIVLAYELVLGLTVPPNNWDSLTYHLSRVAAWVHHGGIYWIPNAPTDRMNEFQPLAEQQVLFLFVATHRDFLYALPQYLAELAILVAVYGSARRLGFEVRAAACSAFLLATFALVALEATTAQTDLVAAAFPIAAGCLLLGSGGIEFALAGFAAAIGAGAKLTTVLVWPVLVWLAIVRGRRPFAIAAAGAIAGFVAIGCWSFVLNDVHTGHLLGYGKSRADHTVSPSLSGTVVTALSTLYETMDLSVLWRDPIHLLAFSGIIAAGVVGAFALGRAGVRRALTDAATVAVPFVAPALVIVGGGVLAFATRRLGTPVRGPGGTYGELNNTASEDSSGFGPIGAVVLIAVPVVTAASFFARKLDIRHLILACALPSFLILLSIQSQFNPWLTRFLIVPLVLTAPLFAGIFRTRATTAAYIAVSALLIGLGITRDTTKPLESPYGAPWQISWVQALDENRQPLPAAGLAALDRAVPPTGCLGAVLNDDSPAYLLSGRNFRRRVIYLSQEGPVPEAARARLEYVVISVGPEQQPAVTKFRGDGWKIRELGGYWDLATAPHAPNGTCI
jgi:hypothetical protein